MSTDRWGRRNGRRTQWVFTNAFCWTKFQFLLLGQIFVVVVVCVCVYVFLSNFFFFHTRATEKNRSILLNKQCNTLQTLRQTTRTACCISNCGCQRFSARRRAKVVGPSIYLNNAVKSVQQWKLSTTFLTHKATRFSWQNLIGWWNAEKLYIQSKYTTNEFTVIHGKDKKLHKIVMCCLDKNNILLARSVPNPKKGLLAVPLH